jgi:hypothetical protein
MLHAGVSPAEWFTEMLDNYTGVEDILTEVPGGLGHRQYAPSRFQRINYPVSVMTVSSEGQLSTVNYAIAYPSRSVDSTGGSGGGSP